MPRVIDHDSRRADLIAAVWRVVLSGGVGEASVRRVATEAGLSTGSVRYFFSDQRELLHAAMREVSSRARERVQAAVGDRQRWIGEGRAGRAVVELLAQTLPLDEERLAEAGVWFAFAAHNSSDDAVQAIRRETDDEVRLLGERCVSDLAALGELGTGRDPVTEAVLLVAVLDGLTLRLLLDPDTLGPDAALDALRAHVAQLRTPLVPMSDGG